MKSFSCWSSKEQQLDHIPSSCNQESNLTIDGLPSNMKCRSKKIPIHISFCQISDEKNNFHQFYSEKSCMWLVDKWFFKLRYVLRHPAWGVEWQSTQRTYHSVGRLIHFSQRNLSVLQLSWDSSGWKISLLVSIFHLERSQADHFFKLKIINISSFFEIDTTLWHAQQLHNWEKLKEKTTVWRTFNLPNKNLI